MAEETYRRRNDDDNCNQFMGIARQISDSMAAVTAATQAQNLAAIQATNGAAQAAQSIATETRSDIHSTSSDILLAQAQTEGRLSPAIERNGGEGRERTASVGAEIRRDLSDVRTDLHQTLEDRASELRTAIGTNHGLVMLEIAKAQFEVIKSKCELEKQAAENFAALQLEACKNQHALSVQMAECCCKTQTAIHAEGEATRDAFQNDKIAELRDRLDCSRRDNDRHNNDNNTRIIVENTINNVLRNVNRTAA